MHVQFPYAILTVGRKELVSLCFSHRIFVNKKGLRGSQSKLLRRQKCQWKGYEHVVLYAGSYRGGVWGREGWGFSMHPMGCEETQRL